jgi:hypothetical protein
MSRGAPPYMSALGGASFAGSTNTGTSARRGNTRFGPGDFNPGVSFGRSGILPLTLESNGSPSGTFNQVEMPSNTFVQVSYAVQKWTNGTDAHILPGMFYFLKREASEIKVGKRTVPCVKIVTLGHLNQILYLAWQTLMQKMTKLDPEAREFFALLEKYGEREIAHFASVQEGSSGNPLYSPMKELEKDPALGAFIAAEKQKDAQSQRELRRLLDIINGNEMYAFCAGPAFIMNRFNFGGVTYNRTNDQTLDGVASLESLQYVFGLNTISSHLAEVHDIFPQLAEMGVGADLFFHLHRRQVAPTEVPGAARGYAFGAFVFEPIACFSQTRPITTNTYRDVAGVMQSGFLLEIGKVHINGSRVDSHITQRIASGMSPSTDLGQIRTSTGQLDKITINLLKFK